MNLSSLGVALLTCSAARGSTSWCTTAWTWSWSRSRAWMWTWSRAHGARGGWSGARVGVIFYCANGRIFFYFRALGEVRDGFCQGWAIMTNNNPDYLIWLFTGFENIMHLFNINTFLLHAVVFTVKYRQTENKNNKWKNKYYQLCCSALPQPTADYNTFCLQELADMWLCCKGCRWLKCQEKLSPPCNILH